MKNIVTSFLLLLSCLSQILFVEGTMVMCLHKGSGSGHLSKFHAGCPQDNSSSSCSSLQVEDADAGQKSSDCFDITLDLLLANVVPGRFLSDSFPLLLTRIPAAIHHSYVPAETTFHQHTTQHLIRTFPQYLTGTVILTC